MIPTTHQITLGGGKQQPVTFQLTDGPEAIKRLKDDFKRLGADISASDEHGFIADNEGKTVAYTMIELEKPLSVTVALNSTIEYVESCIEEFTIDEYDKFLDRLMDVLNKNKQNIQGALDKKMQDIK